MKRIVETSDGGVGVGVGVGMTAAYRPPPARMPPHRCPCGMLISAKRKRCPCCSLRHVQDLRNARARHARRMVSR